MRKLRIQPPASVGLPLAPLDHVMVMIPQRDWLLLRGRMRAVAKISVLPVLLKVAADTDVDRTEGTEVEPDDEQIRHER